MRRNLWSRARIVLFMLGSLAITASGSGTPDAASCDRRGWLAKQVLDTDDRCGLE